MKQPNHKSTLETDGAVAVGSGAVLDRHLYHSQDGIRIFCGDNRVIAPALGEYDLLLSDPPYGLGEYGNAFRAANCGKLAKTTNYGAWTWDKKPSGEELAAMISKAKWQILWGGNHYADCLEASTCWLVWDKDNGESRFADCELA